MRILLDECVPEPLAKEIKRHTVRTTRQQGWASKKNGELIALAEPEFDIFITSDQNMKYQQNLSKRTIAITMLPTNRLEIYSAKYSEDTIRYR